jgi:hypothetical protein
MAGRNSDLKARSQEPGEREGILELMERRVQGCATHSSVIPVFQYSWLCALRYPLYSLGGKNLSLLAEIFHGLFHFFEKLFFQLTGHTLVVIRTRI